MKNAHSKFAVTLGTHYNTEYRVLLTGTPLMNVPRFDVKTSLILLPTINLTAAKREQAVETLLRATQQAKRNKSLP
jgi:hypothetical protein